MSAPAPALQTPPTRRFCNISCVLPIFAEMGRAFAWKDTPHMSSYVGGTRALPPVLSHLPGQAPLSIWDLTAVWVAAISVPIGGCSGRLA